MIYYVAYYAKSPHEPLRHTGTLGTYIPLWDNPISAREWGQSKFGQPEFFIKDVVITGIEDIPE